MNKKTTESMPTARNKTSPLPGDYHPGPKMPVPVMASDSWPTSSAPWRLRIQVSGDSHTTIGMEVKDKIIVGRHDPASGYTPDLDLSPFGAADRGVSRRHLQIMLHDQSLYLEDLRSLNGTRLNGFLLEADHGYRLRDGDEIEVGQIRLVLRFVKSIQNLSPGS